MHGGTDADQTEISAYQVFCLLALDRKDEASRVITAIVATDPFYQPPDTMASPRIRGVFREARRAALPGVAQREYASARAAFDRKDPAAAALFERLLMLLGDPDVDPVATADLRLLAEGFRDLSRAMSAPVPSQAPPMQTVTSADPRTASGLKPETGGPSPPAAVTPSLSTAVTTGIAREGDAGVTPPIPVSQTLPRWIPPSGSPVRQQQFEGVLEVIIDQRGVVTTATLLSSVHPQYDEELLKLARTWTFKPATRDGKPTAFLKVMQIRLRPAS